MQISKGKPPVAPTTRGYRQTKPNSEKKGICMNNTAILSPKASTVEFHGDTLETLLVGEEPSVVLKPICEGIGLDWRGQINRIKRDEVLSSVVAVTTTTGADGKSYQMLTLPLKMLNGWLFGISANRLKPELKAKLTEYRRECFDALANYWQNGIAINPRAFKRGAGDVLTVEEADMLRETLERDAKMLYTDSKQQGAFIRQGWSKLKAHFGVTYRMIPRNELTTAISILQRHGLQAQANDSEFTVPLNSGSEARFVKEVAVRYLDGYQKAIREGYEPPVIESIPPDVLQGIVVSQMENFRMMICFDTDTMQLTRRLVDQDSIVINPDNESQVKGFICEAVPKAMYPMIVGQIARYYQEVAKLQQRQASKQLLVA